MKKTYITPNLNIIQLSSEDNILTGSATRFEVGISNDAMNGSEALSNQKDMWGNEGVWK